MTETSVKSEILRQRLVELTRDLILIPSTHDRPEEIERCLEFVINHVELQEAVVVQRYREEGSPSVVILPRNVSTPEVMLFAHIDVVSRPEGTEYRSTVGDGRIYGPGGGDMKGELAILLEIFRDSHERRPGISLGIAVTSDEETGGAHGTRFLIEKAGVRCGVAIVPDSGTINEIAVEEKGILHLKLRAHGASGHASRPWLVDNPMERMIVALNRVKNYFETLRDGDEHWHPTFALTMLHTENRVANRIPSFAEAVCDIRFPPPYTCGQMIAAVKKFTDVGMEFEVLVSAEPTKVSPDPLFLAATEEITGKPAKLIREHGGSDARFICRYGIPVIMSRPFVGNLHAENEWIDIASMETLYRIYERYLDKKLRPGD
ncbi:MAG TPA: M20 family metallopeptidase [Candidatus Binatia bacterium]|jgi:succinyl-diaminopimelate desuccinylase